MPYLTSKDRELLYAGKKPNTPGELNFLITTMIKEYYRTKGICYQTFNDILGALEGAKLEAYRTEIGPYEDEKLKTNGPVE